MLVLALDTSSPATSCALVELERDPQISDRLILRSRTIAEELVLPPVKAGELLPGLLADLCQRVGRSLDEVAGLAAGLGPGSFTGLRVGLASAKGLAYARNWPLAGCSSLRAMALGAVRKLALESRVIVAALEARKGELFLAAYAIEKAQLKNLDRERVLQAKDTAAWLAQFEKPILLGPGANKNFELLNQYGVSIDTLSRAEQPIWPSAAAVAELCAPDLFENKFDAQKLFALSPVYLAQSEAEKALAEGRVGKLPG